MSSTTQNKMFALNTYLRLVESVNEARAIMGVGPLVPSDDEIILHADNIYEWLIKGDEDSE